MVLLTQIGPIWVHSCPKVSNNSPRFSMCLCDSHDAVPVVFQMYIHNYVLIYKYRNTIGWAGMIHWAILEWLHCNKFCRSWNGLFGQLSKTWAVDYKLCICNQIHDQDSTLFRAVSTMHTTFAAGNKPLAGIDISDLTCVFLQKQWQIYSRKPLKLWNRYLLECIPSGM